MPNARWPYSAVSCNMWRTGGLFLIVARGSKLPRPDRSAVADFHCKWVHLREPDFKGQLLRAHKDSQGMAKRARRFGYPPKLNGWLSFSGGLDFEVASPADPTHLLA